MAIKKHDYVVVDYTGKTKDEGVIFDTTREAVAREHNLHDEHATYKPVVVCVGKQHLIKGIDDQIVGKESGTYTFEVKDVDAFGKKNAKLLKLIPLKLFEKEGIKPFAGLDVNIDGRFGVVKSVSGGRVVVDFNHPLASKDLVYDVEIHRVIDNDKEKVEGLLSMLKFPFINIQVEGDTAVVTTPIDIPEPITAGVIQDITETTAIKAVEFRTEKKANAKIDSPHHEHSREDGHGHDTSPAEHHQDHQHSEDSHDGHEHAHEGHEHKDFPEKQE